MQQSKQQWQIEREESTPQLAGYLNKQIPAETELEVDIRNALQTIDLDFWKIPSSGWQGASDEEFINAIAAAIIQLRKTQN